MIDIILKQRMSIISWRKLLSLYIILSNFIGRTLKHSIPNWQHNSGKSPKRKLKPQALRQARERLQNIKKRYMRPTKRGSSSIIGLYNENTDGSSARNQVPTSEVACY